MEGVAGPAPAPPPFPSSVVATSSSGGSSSWGRSTNLASKPEECSSSTEREARSVALEKAYVHDVYQQIASHFSDSRYRAWPRVKQFLLDLEPGSFVCDVGCGNGKYLSINPSIFKIGLDRCSNLANIAREKEHEVLICDNLALPFRDECFDASLSIAVIHHFATTERRVAALKELARVLRIGGKLMVSVWAMEQRHRKFESQDVLVPWSRPMTSSSDDKTSSIERDLNSTTTSDDDATHYHAYTQTSDSDSFPSIHDVCRKRGRVRHHRGRSIDPTCPSSSQSSSDLSSPNESCYSFVRRALQKLAGTRRNRGGRRPWFLQGLDIAGAGSDEIAGAAEQFAYMDCGDDIGGCLDYPYHPHHRSNDGVASNGGCGGCGAGGAGTISVAENLIPIELRQLESTEYAELFQQPQQHPSSVSAPSKAALLFSNVLYPRRRRTLEATSGNIGHFADGPAISAQPKSKSLSDLLGLLPVGLLRSSQSHKKDENGKKRHHSRATGTSSEGQPSHVGMGEHGGVGPLVQSFEDSNIGPYRRHASVQTQSMEESLDETKGPGTGSNFSLIFPQDRMQEQKRRQRPILVKQKRSICSDPEEDGEEDGAKNCVKKESREGVMKSTEEPEKNEGGLTESTPVGNLQGDNGTEEKRDLLCSDGLPALPPKASLEHPAQHQKHKLKHQKKSIPPASIPFWKQTSMNDELIFSGDRLKEKERLKQQVQKQCSLNEELIYNKGRTGQGRPQENTRWDQMKEAFLKNSSNVKCFQLIKNGLSRGFRGGTEGGNGSAASTASNGGGLLPVPNENGKSAPETIGISSGNGIGTDGSPNSTGSSLPDHHHQQNVQQNGTGDGEQSSSQHNPPPRGASGTTSLRNGIVRMLQNWKQSDECSTLSSPGGRYASSSATNTGRRGLFPPFFLRRSSAGSLTLVGKQGNKQDHHHHGHHLNHHGQCSSPGPLSPLGKGVGEGGDINGASNGMSGGNKLLPGVRHVRKLSREDGSDSSKDSSFQSDTSVDSEDSFASVIFIPKSGGGLDDFTVDFCGTRANSTDSDRSPKSPASRLSPSNHGNLPKSPSPLAQEIQVIMKKRSPDVSPADPGRHLRLTPGGSTSSGFSGSSGCGEATKFLFDESATTRLLAGDEYHQPLLSSPGLGETEEEKLPCHPEPEDVTSDRHYNYHQEQNPITPISSSTSTSTTTNVTPSTKFSSSGKRRLDKIEVLRRPGVIPEGKSGLTRQLVRRSLPKALAVELFNPETDDADTSDTSSSSPNSVSSVVSVVNEDSSAGGGQSALALFDEAKQPIITEEEVDEIEEEGDGTDELDADEREEEESASSGGGMGDATGVVNISLESLMKESSPKARKKTSLAKLGSTSEWLSSLDVTPVMDVSKKSGLKSLKKFGQRSSAEEALPGLPETSPESSEAPNAITTTPAGPHMGGGLSLEMLEERDSLFDSMENLTNNSRQQPSRNPSIDSSVRMSSTCSCSIRGGDSFDSWTSAKSSLTSSSCTQPPPAPQKSNLISGIPLPVPPSSSGIPSQSSQPLSKMSSLESLGTNKKVSVGGLSGRTRREAQSRIRVQSSSKSSSAAGEDVEDSTALTCHRYYHVFREGELDKLIEKYVQNLHIISSYYDHANWCIIAEKVQVWTI